MQTREGNVIGYAQQILNQVRTVVVGKDSALLWVLAAILAKGHILLEDIPGVGKTTMALAFSKVLDLKYSRVQFTPDVLPSDVTGYSVLDQASGTMVYQPGAVLCTLILADELTRATSRWAGRLSFIASSTSAGQTVKGMRSSCSRSLRRGDWDAKTKRISQYLSNTDPGCWRPDQRRWASGRRPEFGLPPGDFLW